MSILVKQLIHKMGLADESNVLDKTTELLRLFELRATNMPTQVNEYSKTVLCADLAATVLGIGFDKEQALKLSGLRKSQYANHKRMFEKLLDLNRLVGVNDICVQLCLTEVTDKADKLLQLYKQVVANECADIDVSHPQYAAMAVYQACKLQKRKCAKPKIMSYSNLRPTQWQQLEQRWDKFLTKHYRDIADGQLGKQVNIEAKLHAVDKNCDKNKPANAIASTNLTSIEEYEVWRKRILSIAEQKLRQEQQLGRQMEKENLVAL